MSTKHIRTAADLARFGAGLKIECSGCGNARTMDGFDAVRRCGSGENDHLATDVAAVSNRPVLTGVGLSARPRCGSFAR